MSKNDDPVIPSVINKDQNRDRMIPETHWRNIIKLLQEVPDDYSQAKYHLNSIYQIFNERELNSRQQISEIMPVLSQIQHIKHKADVQKASSGTGSSSNSLRVHCLGNFEIILNWKKYDRWQSLKAKSLIKYLLLHKNRPVSREALIEVLWPECDPEAGNNNLKSTIYTLRQMFARSDSSGKTNTPVVIYSDGSYFIDPAIHIWIDVDEFESYWLAGRRLEKNKQINEAIKYYQFAEDLYRGDFLEDEMYTEWTLLKREALKDTYLAILIKLIGYSFKEEDYENCIVYCQKILSRDSCHEEAYMWLMKCYSRLGQKHRAQQWYEIYENTIRKELDSSPSQKINALHKQILNQETV